MVMIVIEFSTVGRGRLCTAHAHLFFTQDVRSSNRDAEEPPRVSRINLPNRRKCTFPDEEEVSNGRGGDGGGTGENPSVGHEVIFPLSNPAEAVCTPDV